MRVGCELLPCAGPGRAGPGRAGQARCGWKPAYFKFCDCSSHARTRQQPQGANALRPRSTSAAQRTSTAVEIATAQPRWRSPHIGDSLSASLASHPIKPITEQRAARAVFNLLGQYQHVIHAAQWQVAVERVQPVPLGAGIVVDVEDRSGGAAV
jgi:hypothetical protein